MEVLRIQRLLFGLQRARGQKVDCIDATPASVKRHDRPGNDLDDSGHTRDDLAAVLEAAGQLEAQHETLMAAIRQHARLDLLHPGTRVVNEADDMRAQNVAGLLRVGRMTAEFDAVALGHAYEAWVEAVAGDLDLVAHGRDRESRRGV